MQASVAETTADKSKVKAAAYNHQRIIFKHEFIDDILEIDNTCEASSLNTDGQAW